ncbi:MAG: pbg, partial [Phycisphaerales bacterium]|nr:pbg [Phycisphaerales bacterium]
MQAVSHGSDSVMYFQWRKSRGGVEKFHGAVVDHHGADKTRVFKDVADLGGVLEKLDGVVGAATKADVAIIYDYENRWAIEDAAGPRKEKGYFETVQNHYAAFWQRGVSVDIVESVADFSKYKLLIAPMLYMLRPGAAEKIEAFVAAGGTFVTTYFSGIVDQSDLCFLTGFPGPLRKLCGIWAEEIDTLYDDEFASVEVAAGNTLGLTGTYAANAFCDLIHAEDATVLATYASQFYAGRQALTVNQHGKVEAYYVAARMDERFTYDFYDRLIQKLDIAQALGGPLPKGVTAQVRSDGGREYVFVLSFARQPHELSLGDRPYVDPITGARVTGTLSLPAYGAKVLIRETKSH